MITTELQSAMQWGATLETADAAMVLLHGRGGSATDMRGLSGSFPLPGYAFIAPEAPGQTWYPFPFTAPVDRNEPHLSRALERIRTLLGEINQAGIPSSRIMLLGFSQGACLATEFAARQLDCCAVTVGLSGGLIGPPGQTRKTTTSQAEMTVFLGCGDRDPHIPVERVEETAAFFEAAGATVDKRIYPGMGHLINQDEVQEIKRLMATLRLE
ncbi:MAG: phospholipase [Acidobacteria bacterium]|nr:MAG: phospholipase [Acidobacteriota bacterium]